MVEESGDRQRLVVEQDGAVVRVWLARPEKRNALDTRTLEELIGLYRSFETDYSVERVGDEQLDERGLASARISRQLRSGCDRLVRPRRPRRGRHPGAADE